MALFGPFRNNIRVFASKIVTNTYYLDFYKQP